MTLVNVREMPENCYTSTKAALPAGANALPQLQREIFYISDAVEEANSDVHAVSLDFHQFCEHHDLVKQELPTTHTTAALSLMSATCNEE